jgi:hypothetical protein
VKREEVEDPLGHQLFAHAFCGEEAAESLGQGDAMAQTARYCTTRYAYLFLKRDSSVAQRIHESSSRHQSDGLTKAKQCNGEEYARDNRQREHLRPDDVDTAAAKQNALRSCDEVSGRRA